MHMHERTKAKIIKIILTIVISISIIFALMMLVLRYHVEGETNLPFKISKIVIVSSIEGTEEAQAENIWAINVNQNNDVYLYIEKNENYGKTEIVNTIKLSNFQIKKETTNGNITVYKPSSEENRMFNNILENEIKEITYTGETEANLKQLKIANQGGLLAFRCANNNISKYISNEAQEVNHDQLLQITNVKQEELKLKISFDIAIDVLNKNTYQATMNLELPVGDIINEGTTNLEITDLDNVVFKVI